MFQKSSCPGCSFCSGTISTERPGEDWVWGEKIHAGHEISIFMPPAWPFFSSQPSLLSVEPDFMPGMKSGSTEGRLGWDEKKSHAGHEISIFMPGMKIEISCRAWIFFASNPVFSRSLDRDCFWAKKASRAWTFPKHALPNFFLNEILLSWLPTVLGLERDEKMRYKPN